MTYNAVVTEVFLSSPDDVRSEREFVVKAAAEWNRVRGRETASYISILTWEEMVAPALMDRPQEVINQQIGGIYDVYLGIMWTRFGSPTGRAESGTEEEFDNALRLVRGGRGLRIAMLFKSSSVDLTKVDGLQLHKVQEFKKRVSAEGAFYREFNDDEALRSALNLLFEQIARESQLAPESSLLPGDVPSSSAVSTNVEGDNFEDCLIEVGEKFVQAVALFAEQMTALLEAENGSTNKVREVTAELSQIVDPTTADQVAIKRSLRRVARSMNSLADQYLTITPEVEIRSGQIASLIDTDLRIRFEFQDWHSSGLSNLESATELSITIGSAIQQLDILMDQTHAIPRLSGEVNRAKGRLNKERQKLLEVFVSLKQSLDSSINFFKQND